MGTKYKKNIDKYSDEEFKKLVNNSKTWDELAKKFGYNRFDKDSYLNTRIKKLSISDLNTPKKYTLNKDLKKNRNTKFSKLSDREFINIVSSSLSWIDIYKKIGYKGSPPSYINEEIKKKTKDLNIYPNNTPDRFSYYSKKKKDDLKYIVRNKISNIKNNKNDTIFLTKDIIRILNDYFNYKKQNIILDLPDPNDDYNYCLDNKLNVYYRKKKSYKLEKPGKRLDGRQELGNKLYYRRIYAIFHPLTNNIESLLIDHKNSENDDDNLNNLVLIDNPKTNMNNIYTQKKIKESKKAYFEKSKDDYKTYEDAIKKGYRYKKCIINNTTYILFYERNNSIQDISIGQVYNTKTKKWMRIDYSSGYGRINIGEKKFTFSRFLWEYLEQTIPKNHQIDHINEDTQNDNLSNLQCITIKKNQEKRGKNNINKRNKSSKWYKVVYNNNKVEECNQTKLTDILNICRKTCNKYTILGFPNNKLQEKDIKNIIEVQ